MISDKQLQANRASAKKSTGPKTEIGKSIASKNATTHGLRSTQPVIEGEDPAEYNDFRNNMVVQFAPNGPMETLLVDRIVHAAWRLRRIGTIEVEVYDFLRHPPEKETGKNAASHSARPSQRYPTATANRKSLRFTTFAEAMDAWNKSEDGILQAQNKWPTDPGCPTPSDSFSKFIRQPAQQNTLHGQEIFSDAIDRARAKTDSIEDHVRLDQLAEMQQGTITQTATPPLPLSQAIVNDMQNNELLTRLSRYETTIERSMFKNLRYLQYLQSKSPARHIADPPDV